MPSDADEQDGLVDDAQTEDTSDQTHADQKTVQSAKAKATLAKRTAADADADDLEPSEDVTAKDLLHELMAGAKQVDDGGYTISASHELVSKIHDLLADA